MTLKENICNILKDCGFNLKSQEGYAIQIFNLENVVVIVEEKQPKKNEEK